MSNNANSRTNENMVKVAPELASSFAQYPIKRKAWLHPSANINDSGTPAFISNPEVRNNRRATMPPVLKLDYVYGRAKLGWGYYHLLTKESYIALWGRLRNEAHPPARLCCFASPIGELYEEVKAIVYNRSTATRPDDILAYQESIVVSQGTAQAHYNVDQTIQFAVMKF